MKIALISLCALLSAGVSAQERFPVGDRGNSASVPEDTSARGVARQVMERFAVCTYRSQRRIVERILLAPVSGDPRNLMVGLAKSECLQSGELGFDPVTFRGSLFAAMHRSHFNRLVPNLASAPIVDYGGGADPTYAVAMKFADCVVRADAPHSTDLVRAFPSSAAEAEALRTLMPALSNCVSAGNSSKFHKTTLRGFIAESLFKLSSASQTGARN